jgi:Na+/H+ antiporter NhaD/arsenite permease-like protein
MTKRVVAAAAIAAWLALAPNTAFAADHGHGIDGAALSLVWALPFVGILLSIATGPLFYAHLWEHHYGKFTTVWIALVVIPLLLLNDPSAAATSLLHTLLLEYLPFILLLIALFTTAGGVYVEGNLRGTPAANAILLAIGTVLASFVGTTGASMIMIRPVLRANDDRVYRAHTVVFFIFLVSNIGGALTPLGDPPLFVGFLKGVDFFWTLQHLWEEMLVVAAIVLVVFFAIDWYLHKREKYLVHPLDPTPDSPVRLHGLFNLFLIGVVIAAILMSAYWKPGVSFHIHTIEIELQDALRNAIFVAVILASVKFTHMQYRSANGFSWGPMQEVAILFAGIFVCVVPVIAMLQAGADGAFAPVLQLVTHADGTPNNAAYFWLTGGLSSFLDNAPTYLVFFELAHGDPKVMMTTMAGTLAAISTGAVFMGANSYIGNAPNFMVYAIARQGGVKMPSFFGYMLWSGCILIPAFLIATVIFF